MNVEKGKKLCIFLCVNLYLPLLTECTHVFPLVVLPSSTYLFTVGVEGFFYFHLITLKHTPQSVGLLWTGDRPFQRPLPDNKNTEQETNIHAFGGIRTHDPSKRSAEGLRVRPRGHWDRLPMSLQKKN
jgi:hypothetical protein